MKRVVKKTVVYLCGVCRQEYRSARAARACERAGVEKKAFKKGDRVRVRCGERTCTRGHEYVCHGAIRRVLGPLPYDAEIFLKGFGVPDAGLHKFLYEIPCDCPTCGCHGGGLYPAELLQRSA